MTWVSSLHRAPLKIVSPVPRAASIRARLVMLFDPGTVIVADTRCGRGTISMSGGKDIR